jgi:acyl-CoA synthetase (AMP-forming)/AMP-acid ligase II
MIQCAATAEVAKDDVLCAILPFFHIYGMTVLMNCGLRAGATLVTMPKFDPAGYLKILKIYGVTIAHVAPPVVNFLAKHPAVESVLPLPKLKELLSGAAPLGQELADAAKKRLGITSLRQGYGMTEMSPASHIGVFGSSKSGSIGRLVPNMLCKIVDPETGSPKGFGEAEVGEMWLKGPNIMQGYLGDHMVTAETIVEDGWLRTGDIAYVDADGDYWIVDRLKELIKVKGFQVAPAELEDLLLKHPEIVDAAVIGVAAPREGDGQVPKAFVVKQEGSELTEEAVKKWAMEKVNAYKAIAHVEFIDKVPKSASGKILRKDLRAREGNTFA